MNIGFLHIGMMKTATTYMQNTWLNDPLYCTSVKSTIPLIRDLQELVKHGGLKENLKVELKIDESYSENQKVIVSNEGFSTAFLNMPSFQNRIPDFIGEASRVLGNLLSSTNNLLLVVREPLSWIKSVFKQSIAEGGYQNIREFVNLQNNFIIHSLDIESIVTCYDSFFNNVLILPLELLAEDEQEFWKRIEIRFKVSVPSIQLNRLHESLSSEKIKFLSEINKFSNFFISELNSIEKYTKDKLYEKEIETLNNNYYLMNKWVHRRFVEFGSKIQIEKARSFLNINQPADQFYDFELSSQLKYTIQKKFIGFLRKNYSFDLEILEYYEKCLELNIK